MNTNSADAHTNQRAIDADRPARDLAQIILRNTILSTIGQWLIRLLNFAFMIYVARVLSETGLGQYATVIAFVGVAGIFFELGVSQYTERSIAQDHTRVAQLFWNLTLTRLILSGVALLIVPPLTTLLGYDSDIVFGIALLTGTFLPSALLVGLTTVVTGRERFDVATAVQVIGQLGSILFSVLFLQLGFGFLALLYSGYLVMPLQILFLVWAIRRYQLGPLDWHFRPQHWLQLIRLSVPFGLSALALNFNYNADTIALGFFHPADEVGWYVAAYRLVFTVIGVADGLLATMTPSLAREYVHDPARVRSWSLAAIRLLLAFALPAALGLSMISPQFVVLLYGERFAASGFVLQILAWDIPLALMIAFGGNLTTAMGLEKPAARIFLLIALLNIVLNLLAAPFWGRIGAAVVTLITDVIAVLFFYRLLHSVVGLHALRRDLLRIVLASAVMGGIIWLAMPHLYVLVTIALGGICYGVMAWRLGVIDPALLLRRRSGQGNSAEETI